MNNNVMTETPGMSREIKQRENELLSKLLMSPTFGPYNPLPPGEWAPTRPGVSVPIGNLAGTLSNKEGNKFTRGWLSGAGGADIEQNLGSCSMDIRPAPYNNRLYSDFRAVVPMYGAPVPGLSNMDVDTPSRTFGPLEQARAEWIPTTWSNRLAGLDVVSGNTGPRVATAKDGITSAPTPQYYAYGQVREGGDGFPSYPFGQKKSKPIVKAAAYMASRKVGAAGDLSI